MKSIILASIVIFSLLPFSLGLDCQCSCCTKLPSDPNCTPVDQPIVNVIDCSLCSGSLCTTTYPSQCPVMNSTITNACLSVTTSGPTGTTTTSVIANRTLGTTTPSNTANRTSGTTARSIGVNINGSQNIIYLLFTGIALLCFLGK